MNGMLRSILMEPRIVKLEWNLDAGQTTEKQLGLTRAWGAGSGCWCDTNRKRILVSVGRQWCSGLEFWGVLCRHYAELGGSLPYWITDRMDSDCRLDGLVFLMMPVWFKQYSIGQNQPCVPKLFFGRLPLTLRVLNRSVTCWEATLDSGWCTYRERSRQFLVWFNLGALEQSEWIWRKEWCVLITAQRRFPRANSKRLGNNAIPRPSSTCGISLGLMSLIPGKKR